MRERAPRLEQPDRAPRRIAVEGWLTLGEVTELEPAIGDDPTGVRPELESLHSADWDGLTVPLHLCGRGRTFVTSRPTSCGESNRGHDLLGERLGEGCPGETTRTNRCPIRGTGSETSRVL